MIKSKRGSEYFTMSWNVLARLIVVFFFIFLPVFAFIIQVTSSDYFEKNYLATDLAILTDTVLASPNDLIFVYPRNTQKFSFDIEQNNIRVINKKGTIIEGSIAKSGFVEDPTTKLYYDEVEPIYTYVGETPEYVIPVRIAIVKAGDTVRYYNTKEELIK